MNGVRRGESKAKYDSSCYKSFCAQGKIHLMIARTSLTSVVWLKQGMVGEWIEILAFSTIGLMEVCLPM